MHMTNSTGIVDLVTYTEEIIHGKLHFLGSEVFFNGGNIMLQLELQDNYNLLITFVDHLLNILKGLKNPKKQSI